MHSPPSWRSAAVSVRPHDLVPLPPRADHLLPEPPGSRSRDPGGRTRRERLLLADSLVVACQVAEPVEANRETHRTPRRGAVTSAAPVQPSVSRPEARNRRDACSGRQWRSRDGADDLLRSGTISAISSRATLASAPSPLGLRACRFRFGSRRDRSSSADCPMKQTISDRCFVKPAECGRPRFEG